MGDPSLRELEHDLEVARSKFARDLATLRSPDTYSQFTSALKQEVFRAKDAVFDKAKASAQSAVESWIEELKRRAAANPTAALAVGAGIAWRLIQRPPVATALIGAGLISLLRTNVAPANGRTNDDYMAQAAQRLREQTTDFASEVKEQAGRVLDAAADRAGEVAGALKVRAGDAMQAAADQVGDVASAAKDRVQEWGNQAASAVRDAAVHAQEETASLTERATEHVSTLRQSVARSADREVRDSLLLGIASAAVIAAVGIACQKKLGETVTID